MKYLIVVTTVLFALLFFGGPNYETGRLIKEIWETGHFFLFAFLIFLAQQLTRLKKSHWITSFLSTNIICIGFGLATELTQLLVGRDFQLVDIFNDVVGGYAGLLFSFLVDLIRKLQLKNKIESHTELKYYVKEFISYSLAIFILLGIGIRGLLFALIDQQTMRQDFPILSSFESSFEIKRWDNNSALLSISTNIKRSGNHSMKVDFFPNIYPDITLQYFLGHWQNYKYINFSIFNSHSEPIKLIAKIYDSPHRELGYIYSDRFNKGIYVSPGWNDFNFSLDEVSNAPKNRKMDLTSIDSFSLFMMELDENITIYLDDVYLSNL